MAAALLLLAVLAAPGSGAPRGGRELHVFAAASLAGAFRDIAERYQAEHAGTVVRLNLAGSQQLAMQLEQGATADVFASADARWMDHVRERGLVAGEPVPFAGNRLVVIVPATNPARIRRLADLARPGVKLVLGVDAVPVGRYARIALRQLAREPGFGADFAARALRNVVSEEENVKSVVGKVQLGEADAGVVYRSDATGAVARDVRVLELPESANVRADYPIAVLAAARDTAAARAFVALVLSAEGQQLLSRRGLLPVAPVAR